MNHNADGEFNSSGDELSSDEKIAYLIGYKAGLKEGIRRYAWWKDGQQYVGSCGTTLAAALEEAAKERQ